MKCFLAQRGGASKFPGMANKKAATKGKRYTPDEKRKIVEFVNRYNADSRRGGASAAAKKFEVSQLSIGSWLKVGWSPEVA